jgi:chromate transport protein ChrA
MSPYFLKTILGAAFLAAALTSFLSMMTLMGKPEKKTDPAKLKKIHRTAGIVIGILLAPLIYLGARFLAQTGDAMSIRAGFHVVLAITFVVLLILKIAIVRIYRNFLKYAPALGMIIFTLAVIVFAISAGFTLVMKIF